MQAEIEDSILAFERPKTSDERVLPEGILMSETEHHRIRDQGLMRKIGRFAQRELAFKPWIWSGGTNSTQIEFYECDLSKEVETWGKLSRLLLDDIEERNLQIRKAAHDDKDAFRGPLSEAILDSEVDIALVRFLRNARLRSEKRKTKLMLLIHDSQRNQAL